MEELKSELNAVATAFTLIARASHAGDQADSVIIALKYLDNRHTNLTKQLEEMQPAAEAIIEASTVEVK